MSTVSVDRLSGEPIVILTVSGSATDLRDAQQAMMELQTVFDEASEGLFFILDVSDVQISLDELLRGASNAYRGDNPIFKHPNIRETLQVSNDPALALAAEGFDTEIFGNVKIQLFATLDEAVAHARAAM